MTETIAILIVDDEAPARAQLSRYIKADKRFEIVGEAENGPQALDQVASLDPDLLLLDIQMPGMTGLDVLRLLENPPPVIFITAYDEYAVKAFEVSAIDYLLKPVSQQRFQQALNKALEPVEHLWKDKLQKVLDNISDQSSYVDRLPVRHLKTVQLLPVGDISHIVSENRLVHVYDRAGKRFWTGETLSQLEKRLDPEFFMRIHRSSIINMSTELHIEPWEDGRLRVHLPEGTVLTASRAQAGNLKKRLSL